MKPAVGQLFAVLAFVLALIHPPLGTLAAEPRAAALTGEQLREQAALLTEFRKAKGDSESRLAIIERAAQHSRHTLRNVLEVLVKEMNRPLAEYRQLFSKAAGDVLKQRASPVNLQQVTELRTRVLDLAKQEGLTKEMITTTSDPALNRLKEIFLVDREEVLKAHPELGGKREALATQGKLWERCAALMMEDAEKPQDKEPPRRGKPDGNGEGRGPGAAAADGAVASQPPSFDEYLKKEEEIAAALAAPMAPATRAVLATNLQLATKVDPEEARCILDLNLTRNLLGLSPLRIDLALTAVARDHSSDMEQLKFFSHDSPVFGKTTPWDRAKRAGTSASAENIAMGTVDGAVANRMWWHSPGHHKNMLGNHARVGVGSTGKYWTEMFGQ